MGVKLVSASGGSVEINPPTTASNFIATMPAATGNVVVDSATQSFTNKSFNSAQFATVTGTAPIYPCRAWVNFNGTGTVAIRASGNVTSITDNGTGDYTVNFTTAMPDADFGVGCMAGTPGARRNDMSFSQSGAPTTSSVRVDCYDNSSNTLQDPSYVTLGVFR